MMTQQVIDKIQAVLDSDLTAYRIAKEVGYSSANPVHKLIKGESEIVDMKLSTAVEFEKLYNRIKKEMEEMENIKQIIQEVLDYKRHTDNNFDPDYHEQEYMDGVSDHFIIHKVEGFENLEVYFPEHKHVKELREKDDEEELNEFFLSRCNESADKFDYDKIVAYRLDNGQIVWL